MIKKSPIFLLMLIATSSFSYELLPSNDEARAALMTSPKIIGAESRRNSLNYKADSIETGPEEFVVRGNKQRRNVSNDAVPGLYQEYSAAIERPVRMWGKVSMKTLRLQPDCMQVMNTMTRFMKPARNCSLTGSVI